MTAAVEEGPVEFRDVMSILALFAASIFGARLWARDRGKDNTASVEASVRVQFAVETLTKEVTSLRSDMVGMVTRLETRDADDHAAVLRELDHLRSENHELAGRLGRLEGWIKSASDTGAFPKSPELRPTLPRQPR